MSQSWMLALVALGGVLAVAAGVLAVLWRKSRWDKHFSNLGFDGLCKIVARLAIRGWHNETVVLEATSDADTFLQFRKYIERGGHFGVDVVIPDANRSDTFLNALRDILDADGLVSKSVPSPFGWCFHHIEVARGDRIDRVLLKRIVDLHRIDLEGGQTLHVAKGGTFDLWRRREVKGAQTLSAEDIGRYDLFDPAGD